MPAPCSGCDSTPSFPSRAERPAPTCNPKQPAHLSGREARCSELGRQLTRYSSRAPAAAWRAATSPALGPPSGGGAARKAARRETTAAPCTSRPLGVRPLAAGGRGGWGRAGQRAVEQGQAPERRCPQKPALTARQHPPRQPASYSLPTWLSGAVGGHVVQGFNREPQRLLRRQLQRGAGRQRGGGAIQQGSQGRHIARVQQQALILLPAAEEGVVGSSAGAQAGARGGMSRQRQASAQAAPVPKQRWHAPPHSLQLHVLHGRLDEQPRQRQALCPGARAAGLQHGGGRAA